MNENNKILPWQFSTLGIVLGCFFGFFPVLIALLGNHQFKQNKETKELAKAYNIILIISIILIILVVIIFIIFHNMALISPFSDEPPANMTEWNPDMFE